MIAFWIFAGLGFGVMVAAIFGLMLEELRSRRTRRDRPAS